jgi:phage gpG-like protein
VSGGISIKASGNVTGPQRLAQKIGSLPKAVRVVAKQMGEEARDLVFQGFASGTSPDGAAWAPLAVRGGMPLVDSGRPRSSITLEVSDLGFHLGTNVFYAGVHQNGATIRVKKAKTLYSSKLKIAFGKQVTIPARPFLPTADLPGKWATALSEVAKETVEALLQ